ncbi:2-alkenal reductase [Sulfolobus acidocaldarius SUSAZ]|nr:2-alkenal reductase [Sulfolobus acidocaldarius SUSAZ]
MDFSAVVDDVSKSVVTILTKQITLDDFLQPSVAQGLGSGFSIGKGLIMTSYHVIGQASSSMIITRDGFRGEAEIIAVNPFNDLALIKTDLDLTPLKLTDDVKVGQGVLAVGSPLGLDSTTFGIVSSVDRTIQSPIGSSLYVIQTDAAVNPGNSGGPLVNTKGEVVGVITAMIPYAQGIGFAIPSRLVMSFIENIKKNGRYIRPYIGVRIIKLNRAMAVYFNLSVDEGVIVIDVDPRSPAYEAGIRRGDVIYEINSKKVKSQLDIIAGIEEKGLDQVELGVYRGKNKLKMSIEPIELS